MTVAPAPEADRPAPLDALLEDSWAGRGRAIRGRELRVELAVTVAFLAAAVLLAVAADSPAALEPVVVGVVLAMAVAARVEFPVGAAYFTPTQLFLVPLFVVAPAQVVPLLVFAAFALAALGAALTRRAGVDRVVFGAGDAAHALGPAIVLTVFADGDASSAALWVLVLAAAAQMAADLASSSLHEILSMGARAQVQLRMMSQIWMVDVGLGTVGVLAAVVAVDHPAAALAPLPMVGLLMGLARDRSRRIGAAQERLVALEHERARREAAAESLTRQNRFLQDVSHELRTPVTIARGHAETLRRHRGPSPESAVVLDELERIERIVERLLLLARADEPGSITRRSLDAEQFLEDRFVRWSDTIPRAWQLGTLAQGTLHADPDALTSALDALFENAVKHTTGTQLIGMSSSARDGALAIEIADHGAGIPADAIERIFERFARVDSARNRHLGGAGLGLAVVDAVAKAHGGSCTVASSAAGTTFTMLVPGLLAPVVTPEPASR